MMRFMEVQMIYQKRKKKRNRKKFQVRDIIKEKEIKSVIKSKMNH